MFRCLCFGLLMLGLTALPLSAAELKVSRPEVRKAAIQVIEQQLAAFRRNQPAKAYALASEPLRRQKPLQVFTDIVAQNYPEVWSNTRAEFGIVRDDAQRAKVTVQVYSKAGDASYDYELQLENGTWRIHGVLRHASSERRKA